MKKLVCLLIAGFAVIASSCGYKSCEVEGSLNIQVYQEHPPYIAYEISISPSGEVSVSSYDNRVDGGIRRHLRRASYKRQVSPEKFNELHRLIHEVAIDNFHEQDDPSACKRYAFIYVYHSPIDADPHKSPVGVLYADCPGEAQAARKVASAFVNAARAGNDVEEWPKKGWRE